MSRREEYEKQTEELLEPIVAEQGFELVDVEYVKEAGNWYLRAYIDKPGGITVDDCEVVSRRFSDILDEKDYIEDSYIFEVSSPGLGRPLKKEKDFIRSVGQEVEIRTYRAINRQKEFVGILKEFDQNTVTISYEDDSTQTFEKSEIALIRFAEMLLFRAEAYLMTNKADLATADLNRIRKRANVALLTGTATMADLYHERRCELAFEFTDHLYDLKRWYRSGNTEIKALAAAELNARPRVRHYANRQDPASTFVVGEYEDYTDKIAYQDYMIVFPYPSVQITKSDGKLKQNPHYD